jgi:4-hydroxyphenylpyruvate dioxygenase-like putative hemolysin
MELTDHRMPNDPQDLPNWRRDWAAGRPDRPHAAAHEVCAPRDPAAAIAFLVEVLGGEAGAASALQWPQAAAATPVRVADATLLILDPADRASGPVGQFVSGPNAGVYAVAWQVADAEAAAARLGEHGAAVERTAPGAPWTHQALVDGARHWFIQAPAS